MEVERNLVVITPARVGPDGRRHSIISSTKFEIRKPSDNTTLTNKKEEADRSQSSKLCYRMSDVVMTMLIVFPLTIGIWRGIWQIMEFYCIQWGVEPWLSMLLGYFIPFTMYWFQEPLKKKVIPGKMNFVSFYIISRCLLIIHAFGGINQWRGVWKLLDMEIGLGELSSLVTLVFGTFVNLIFRTFSNVLAPPLLCCVDEAFSIHDCTLRFKTPPTEKCKYFWDILFSVIIIPTLTVFGWRGLWNLADIYLYPEDQFLSAMASLGLGYFICIILCSVQPFIGDFVYNLKGLGRLALIDLTYMAGFVGCVFAWRGVWNSYNILIVFDSSIPCLSEWVTTIVGIFGTIFLGCFSTVMVRGIVIDGEMEENDAAEWLIPYISHLRNKIDNVPFPEPWVCRYLCTSQKMNYDKIRARPRGGQKMNSVANSIHPISVIPPEEDCHIRQSKNPRIRLSQIPHIDSSSEDSLGEREAMIPNPELDQQQFQSGSKLQEVITKFTKQADD